MADPLDPLRNFGFVCLNQTATAPHATVIVTGLPRSGTSMFAGLLTLGGYHPGDAADTAVFEDRLLAEAIERGKKKDAKRLIEGYNEAHQRWFLKRPNLFKSIGRYEP